MRTFKIYNNDGLAYDLTETRTGFFYNVAGLGMDIETSFQRIGERYEIINSALEQADIQGIVRFFQPGAYAQYFAFAQFVQNTPLYLEYAPEHGTFTRRGVVTRIGKSESNDGQLIAEVTFKAITPWYKRFAETNEGMTSGGKTYDYSYDYTYSNSAAQSIEIESDSYQPCPVIITIHGYALNPTWRHYLNGELVATGAITGEIEEGNKLVIDTTSMPYTIREYDANGQLVADMYQSSDFSTYRFITLGYGRNVISVGQSAVNAIRMSVEALIEYATV